MTILEPWIELGLEILQILETLETLETQFGLFQCGRGAVDSERLAVPASDVLHVQPLSDLCEVGARRQANLGEAGGTALGALEEDDLAVSGCECS